MLGTPISSRYFSTADLESKWWTAFPILSLAESRPLNTTCWTPAFLHSSDAAFPTCSSSGDTRVTRYTPWTPVTAARTDSALVTLPATTSAPASFNALALSLSVLLVTARTLNPLRSRACATGPPCPPVAPKTVISFDISSSFGCGN